MGFNNPIANAAGTLIRAVMKSVNFVAGVAGWQITRAGDAEFNQGTFRGNLTIGTAPNQILIGQTIPALVSNYYAAGGPNGQVGTVRGVLVFESNAQTFVYMALVTPNAGRPFLAFGGVESVGLVLSELHRVTPGTIGANAFGSVWGPWRIEAPGLLDVFGAVTMESGSVWKVDPETGIGPQRMGRGIIDAQTFNTVVGPSGPAEFQIMSTGTITFKNGFAYSMDLDLEFTTSVANAVVVFLWRQNNIAGTRFGQASIRSAAVVGDTQHAYARIMFKNTSGADITDFFIVTAQVTLGATVTLQGSAQTTRTFITRDEGVATRFPFIQSM